MGLDDRPTNELLKRYVFLANTRGIIPNPTTAMRVYVTGVQSGVGDDSLRSVEAGTKLFINAASIDATESADALGVCYLAVKVTGGAWVYNILHLSFEKAGQLSNALSFCPALEVIAGRDVYVSSNHANIDVAGQIFGWQEDV